MEAAEALAKVEIALEEALHARARAHALVVSNEFRRIEVAQSAVKAIESSALAEEQKQQESAKVDMDEGTAALAPQLVAAGLGGGSHRSGIGSIQNQRFNRFDLSNSRPNY
mgnify:CR=1 FL=1